MAYGTQRFLYNNLITSSLMVTPSSQATGFVSGPEKTTGTGEALLVSTGAFTGTSDKIFTVQIDDVSSGTEVGEATYRWRSSETTPGGWEASGVVTSSLLVTLEDGVKVMFIASDGMDFSTEDSWTFYALAAYGPEKMLDRDRGTSFRSGATFPVVIDLGSAKNVTVCCILDHNFSGTTMLTLEANISDSWGDPAYSQALTVADPLIFYLNQTYRYWRINIVDAVISYAEIGELFLGTYLELSKPAAVELPRTYGYTLQEQNLYSGVRRRRPWAKKAQIALDYKGWLLNADITNLVAMQEALVDLTNGKIMPVFVHLFYDETDTVFLMDWINIGEFERVYFRPYLNSIALNFDEVVKVEGF